MKKIQMMRNLIQRFDFPLKILMLKFFLVSKADENTEIEDFHLNYSLMGNFENLTTGGGMVEGSNLISRCWNKKVRSHFSCNQLPFYCLKD